MDHQPFEDWIFKQRELSEDESKQLNLHLQNCVSCNTLNTSWSQVESVLIQTQVVSPVKGFSNRFARRLELRKLQEQQKQSIRYLLIVGIILLILTILLLSLFSLSYTPGEIIIGTTSLITGSFQGFINIRSMIYEFLYNIPPLAISAIWILIALWGLVMLPIWGVAVWKVSKQGVTQK